MSFWQSKTFRILSRALVLAYMALIFYMSSLPVVNVPAPFAHFDKVVHFHVYLGLAFLLANASSGIHHRKRFLAAFLIAAVYGISDEVHQYFVPPRECSFWDWLADISGAWVGAWIYLKSEAIWRKH